MQRARSEIGHSIVVLGKVRLSDAQKAHLAAHGDLTVFEQAPLSRGELYECLAGANIMLNSEVPLDSDALRAAGQLQMISLWSSGYDHVDIQTARELGITVCHAPGCSANAIAEHTLATAIYFTHRLNETDQHVRRGLYSWEAFITPELRGQTFGVIGLGQVGARVAEVVRALGCKVIAYTRSLSPERAAKLGITLVDLDTLLRESDVISINCTLTPETTGLIGWREFDKMERIPILINTARGRVVDQEALLEALRTGQVRAAALDVLRDEPPDSADPLLEMENVLFTPHSAGSSVQAFKCLSELCVQNVEAFLAGRPQNVLA